MFRIKSLLWRLNQKLPPLVRLHAKKSYIGQAVITFSYDDGRKNNFDVALPLHEKFSVPASMAIIAGRTIKSSCWKQHMEPWQVIDAHKRGVEITSHGYHHKIKFPELDDGELEFELDESKKLLSSLLGRDAELDAICIPFSSTTPRVRERANEYYKLVRIKGNKLNDIASHKATVCSFGLTNTTDFESVKNLIDDAIEQKKWLVFMLHGVVDQDRASRKYDVTKALLSETLSYVASIDRKKLLPANFSEVLAIRKSIGVKPGGSERVSDLRPDQIKSPGSYNLAESDGYLITFHKNKEQTNKLLISFGGLPSKKTKKGFGSNFFLKQGYDHIFVAQEAGSQYQKLSLEKFKDVVSPFLQGYDVFTYGSSLGAYCAVYYGGAIDAQIIAAAPKNSAHPSMRKKKFSDVDFLHKEIKDNPLAKKLPIIIYDPYREEESNFIANCIIPAYPHSRLVKLPYAGHTVLNTMLESGVLKQFITSIVERDELIELRLREEGSYIWHAEKGRYFFLAEELPLAEQHLQKSLDLKYTKEAVRFMLKLCLKTENGELGSNILVKAESELGSLKFLHPSLIAKITALSPKSSVLQTKGEAPKVHKVVV